MLRGLARCLRHVQDDMPALIVNSSLWLLWGLFSIPCYYQPSSATQACWWQNHTQSRPIINPSVVFLKCHPCLFVWNTVIGNCTVVQHWRCSISWRWLNPFTSVMSMPFSAKLGKGGVTEPLLLCHLPRAPPGNRISVTPGIRFKNTALMRIETRVMLQRNRKGIRWSSLKTPG